MTNLVALRAKVNYPLQDNTFILCLTNRGLSEAATYSPSSDVQAFDLAYADCLSILVTSPASVSEGGFSVSAGDREKLQAIANKIYSKYGEANLIPSSKTTAKFVQKW